MIERTYVDRRSFLGRPVAVTLAWGSDLIYEGELVELDECGGATLVTTHGVLYVWPVLHIKAIKENCWPSASTS